MRWTDIRLVSRRLPLFPKTVTAVSDLILQASLRGKSHYAPCYCPFTMTDFPIYFRRTRHTLVNLPPILLPPRVQSTFRIASPVFRTFTEFLLHRGISFIFSLLTYVPMNRAVLTSSPVTLVLIVTQREHIPHLKPPEFCIADQRISGLLGFFSRSCVTK